MPWATQMPAIVSTTAVQMPMAISTHELRATVDSASACGFETWRAAAEIAQSLNATATFAGGLRLVEPGRSIASALGLPSDGAVDLALKASTPPPLALGFERLGQTKGVRARLALVRHKVFPPVTFMRRYSPRAATGRRALLRAYLRRWRWLLVHAPAGFRAWRSARRNPNR